MLPLAVLERKWGRGLKVEAAVKLKCSVCGCHPDSVIVTDEPQCNGPRAAEPQKLGGRSLVASSVQRGNEPVEFAKDKLSHVLADLDTSQATSIDW